MRSVKNISKDTIAVRDKMQPGDEVEPDPVDVKPGKSIEVSADKALELCRDYPEHFQYD